MDIKQQWDQTPATQKILLIFLLTGLLAYLMFILFLSPKLEEYSNLEKEVQSLENEVNSLKMIGNLGRKNLYEAKINNLKKEIESNNKKLETLSQIIPSKPMIEDILKTITIFAKLDNIYLNSFKFEKEEEVYLFYDKDSNSLKTIIKGEQKDKEKENKKQQQQIPKEAILVKKVYLTANVSGGINETKKFLNDISNSPRLIIGDNILIKKESSNLLNFNISFITYYMPEEVSK